jgi:hypothetical protein
MLRFCESAKRERKGLQARINKLDLELSVSDGLPLSDQLLQPLFGNPAVALIVNVTSVSIARRLSIDEHAKSRGIASRCQSHDEVKIAGLEAIRDSSGGLIEESKLFLHRQITGQSFTLSTTFPLARPDSASSCASLALASGSTVPTRNPNLPASISREICES